MYQFTWKGRSKAEWGVKQEAVPLSNFWIRPWQRQTNWPQQNGFLVGVQLILKC